MLASVFVTQDVAVTKTSVEPLRGINPSDTMNVTYHVRVGAHCDSLSSLRRALVRKTCMSKGISESGWVLLGD